MSEVLEAVELGSQCCASTCSLRLTLNPSTLKNWRLRSRTSAWNLQLAMKSRYEVEVDSRESHVALVRSTFRDLCKHFAVATLPACVVVNATLEKVEQSQLPGDGNLIDRTALMSTSSFLIRTNKRASALASIVAELLRSTRIDALAHKLRAPGQRLSEDKLAEMRDEASSLFERGEFLAAAQLFVHVLLESPACPKANFNLAVILQMMGTRLVALPSLSVVDEADRVSSWSVGIGETYFAVHFMLQVVAVDDNDSVAHTVLRYELSSFIRTVVRVLHQR